MPRTVQRIHLRPAQLRPELLKQVPDCAGLIQLHGARPDGSIVFHKKLSRANVLGFLASQPSCLVAMEACASAQYRGRAVGRLGHEVKLMPPVYVKPYVKRYKNDAADAEAICEQGNVLLAQVRHSADAEVAWGEFPRGGGESEHDERPSILKLSNRFYMLIWMGKRFCGGYHFFELLNQSRSLPQAWPVAKFSLDNIIKISAV